MKASEIFDTVKKHLLCQKKRCSVAGGRCVLRNDDGLKCAIGALIPEEKYYKTLEGYPTYVTIDMLGLSDHEDILLALQSIHDNVLPENWAEALALLEARLGQ